VPLKDKIARAAYARAKYLRERPRVIARTKAYREVHRDKYVAASKKYYQENKERLLARSRVYGEKNKEHLAAKTKEYREKNKEEIRAKKKMYRDSHKEIARAWREANKAWFAEYNQKNKEVKAAKARVYRVKKRVEQAAYYSAYRKAYRGRRNALLVKYRASQLQRTPKWLTPDDHWMMEEAYDLAARRTALKSGGHAQWHVDHIVPLQGKTVSGLHVPLNLRVIPAAENSRQSNRWVV
jgi:hypothetical protein